MEGCLITHCRNDPFETGVILERLTLTRDAYINHLKGLLLIMTTTDTDTDSVYSFSMSSTSQSPRLDSVPVPLPVPIETTVGVGLSSGSLNLSRRKMLDLVNKLNSTGQVLPPHVFPII